MINVKGCSLCEIWTAEKLPPYRIYYLTDEYAIMKCPLCEKYLIVASEHVIDINKSVWGNILKVSRKFFGGDVWLEIMPHEEYADHWHAHTNKEIKWKR